MTNTSFNLENGIFLPFSPEATGVGIPSQFTTWSTDNKIGPAGTPSGSLLDQLTGFSGTGFLQRTGAGAYSFSATVPGPNLTGEVTTASSVSTINKAITPTWTGLHTFNAGINASLLAVGLGSPSTNGSGDPPVTLSSQFIPSGSRSTADPVVDIERTVSYSAGATASPTLSVITKANYSASTAWSQGILSDIQLTSSSTNTSYVEAIRGFATIGSGVSTSNSAWGGLFNASALGSGSYITVQGIESGVFQASGTDAPVPSATPLAKWAVSHLASVGITIATQNLVDAAFMVNPFSPSGAQVAFYAPVEASGLSGKIIKYAPFAAACASTYGLDLHLGTWATAAIWLPNNSGIQASKAGGGVQTLLYLNASNSVALGPDATFGTGFIQTAPASGAAQIIIAPQAASQNSQVSFYNTATLYWQFEKLTDHSFAIFDAIRGGSTSAIAIPSNGNMQLMKGGGTVGIGTAGVSSAFLSLAAGTTAIAQFNFASSSAPTSPNNGDFWFDGTNFKARVGGVTKTFTIT